MQNLLTLMSNLLTFVSKMSKKELGPQEESLILGGKGVVKISVDDWEMEGSTAEGLAGELNK